MALAGGGNVAAGLPQTRALVLPAVLELVCSRLPTGGETGAQRGKERAQGHTAGRWQEALAPGRPLTVSPAVAATVLPWPWWFPPFY